LNTNDLQSLLKALYKDLLILEEREANYGSEPPLAVINRIDAYKQAIDLTTNAITCGI
jgi:hypothetical protein